MSDVAPVIFCGRSKARFWLSSRKGVPKRFLCLPGNESPFQQAFQRLQNLSGYEVEVAMPVIADGERITTSNP